MKRKPAYQSSPGYNINEFYPRFSWKFCERCGFEFKHENMWSVGVSRWVNWNGEEYPSGKTHYFCKECFPTKESLVPYCNAKTRPDF